MPTTHRVAPLRVLAFRRMWVAHFFSSTGLWLHLVAAPWLVLRLGGGPVLLGIAQASIFAPLLVLALPAGVLADRIDRRRIVVATHVASAVAAVTLAWSVHTGTARPFSVIAVAGTLGVLGALGGPALSTYAPSLIATESMAEAIGLLAGAYNVAKVAGPVLGGALVASGHVATAFALNGASYLAVALAAWNAPAVPAGAGDRGWRHGWTFIRTRSDLSRVVAIIASFACTGIAVQTLLPITSARWGSHAFGLLLAAFGAGGATIAFLRHRTIAPIRIELPAAVALMGASGIALGMTSAFTFAAMGAYAAGFSWVWAYVIVESRLQRATPLALRARVLSLYAIASIGPIPAGSILAGAVATRVGAGKALSLITGTNLVLAVLAARVTRT